MNLWIRLPQELSKPYGSSDIPYRRTKLHCMNCCENLILSYCSVFIYNKHETPEVTHINRQAFRQGLGSGDRSAVYPVLEWLLTPDRTAELKKRSYLARYLVRLTVPAEFLQVDEISQLFEQYEHAIEDFKRAHRENDELKQQLGANLSPADIRREIQAMEEEREQLQKRVERQKQKVRAVPVQSAQ